MKVVMVHGRSQQGKDPVELEKTWRDALTYGLARANAELAPDTEFVFPFYADELDRLVKEVDAPLADTVIVRGNIDPTNKDLRGEILKELAAGLDLSGEDFEREA